MVLRSAIPYRLKHVVVKLWLRLMSLFQPIDQMCYINLFLRVIYMYILILSIVYPCGRVLYAF